MSTLSALAQFGVLNLVDPVFATIQPLPTTQTYIVSFKHDTVLTKGADNIDPASLDWLVGHTDMELDRKMIQRIQ